MNESIYYNVDKIHEAIGCNRQISFRYFDWNLDKEMVPRRDGRLYRLSDLSDSAHYVAWQYVSTDQSRSLLSIVVTDPIANSVPVHIRLKGLDENAVYSVNGEFECLGSALMQGGYTFPRLMGDYPAMQLDIVQVKQ